MTGVQAKTVRDECRSLIHDALVENQMPLNVSHPEYISLDVRIKSFVDWPIEKLPSTEKLAEAGYFYDVKNNILRCFYCDGVSWDMKSDEDPWARHAKWYFNCPYVLSCKSKEFINKCRFKTLKRRDVYNVDFKQSEARMNSYLNWPNEKAPTSEIMSKAGFYFTHLEDKVVCFHCGYGVRNWQRDDNPWYKHAWWSPDCDFLRQHKSSKFIDKVVNDRSKQESLDKCVLIYNLNIREIR